MAVFKIKDIFETDDNETVTAKYQSRIHYYSYCERSYAVLSDETTVIGVEKGNGEKVFVMEDLSNKDPYYKPFKMELHTNDIDCILVNEKLKTILVGDRLGRLKQYTFDVGKNTIEVVREYGLLDIGYIYSGTMMGNLAIVGGNKTYSLRVIDMKKRQIFGAPLETAFYGIHSLNLCQVSDENVVLTVCGVNPDYSKCSDIYNANELLKHHKIELMKIEKKNLVSQDIVDQYVNYKPGSNLPPTNNKYQDVPYEVKSKQSFSSSDLFSAHSCSCSSDSDSD
jgi:hypothetical protein